MTADRSRTFPKRTKTGRHSSVSTWSAWYEQKTNGKPGSYPYILDNGWERTSFDNRRELQKHLDDQERIEYLVSRYPCKFSETMKRDWERVGDYLAGEVVTLPEDALEYRTRLEELRREIKDYTKKAVESFENELGDQLVTSTSVGRKGLPEQTEKYAGKIIRFDRPDAKKPHQRSG